jgi:hypothetical protein
LFSAALIWDGPNRGPLSSTGLDSESCIMSAYVLSFFRKAAFTAEGPKAGLGDSGLRAVEIRFSPRRGWKSRGNQGFRRGRMHERGAFGCAGAPESHALCAALWRGGFNAQRLTPLLEGGAQFASAQGADDDAPMLRVLRGRRRRIEGCRVVET